MKIKQCLIIFFLFCATVVYSKTQGELLKNDSTIVVTPEGIGQYLSTLLIHRGDITESPIAININQLLPNEDFSEYEDSPAGFILAMLHGQQILLSQSWDELLFQADSLHLDKNTRYLKTYFLQTNRDQFTATAVLEHSSKYYAFTFSTIDWDSNRYVMTIANQFKEYSSIDDLKKDLFFDEKSLEMDDEIDSMKKDTADSDKKVYPYNQCHSIEISETAIPSYNSFLDELTIAIKQPKNYNKMLIFKILHDSIELKYNKSLRKLWKNFLSSIHKKKDADISIYNIILNNISFDDAAMYNALIFYSLKSGNKMYGFYCLTILVEDKWQLIGISTVNEEQPILWD
jgi:hypothetical protein